MEPSIASPRRSREGDAVITPREIARKDHDAEKKEVNSPESSKNLYNALEKEANKVPAITIDGDEKKAANEVALPRAHSHPGKPQELLVIRTPSAAPPQMAKSVSTGMLDANEVPHPEQTNQHSHAHSHAHSQGQGHGQGEDIQLHLEEPKSGMKRANSEGVIPKKEEKPDDDLPPVDLEGLFERLHPAMIRWKMGRYCGKWLLHLRVIRSSPCSLHLFEK